MKRLIFGLFAVAFLQLLRLVARVSKPQTTGWLKRQRVYCRYWQGVLLGYKPMLFGSPDKPRFKCIWGTT